MPTPTGYSRLQIRLHWIVAVLIILQYLLHEWVAGAWELRMKGMEFQFHPLIAQHVFGGILILVLVVWRLNVRLKRGAPPPPEAEHTMLKLAAHATHWAFYALMIAMPVSGAVAWFGAVEPAAEAHEVMKVLLLVLFVLHVAAAMMHHFVLKTDVMVRMKRPQE